jgi:hypothetical protein
VTTKQILALLWLAALAGLSACGGGGDRPTTNPTPTPTPLPTGQANLTSANAPTFARFAELAARAAASTRVGETISQSGGNTMQDPGCFAAGSNPAILVLNGVLGNVSGNAGFTNFDRCYGMRLNGNASVSGTLGPLRVDVLTFTFANLSYASSTGTLQLAGTLLLDWISVPPDSRYVITLNATASGLGQFALTNFQVDSVVLAGREDISISGRLTTSDGFVDITPGPTRVELPLPSTGLQNGSIIMTGATTIANVSFNGALPPTITIAPR